jgi:hypothetical protein
MNHGNGDISVTKLGQSPKSTVVHVALPQKREYLALGLQKGLNDGLNMDARGRTLAKCRDLDLAVTNWVGLIRWAHLIIVSRVMTGGQETEAKTRTL